MKKQILILSVALLVAIGLCSMTNRPGDDDNKTENKENVDYSNLTKVEFKTTLGDIVVVLYNETPKHRDNFVKLVKEGYYDGVLFHRVIKDFMIQTGDGSSKNATKDQMLGAGDLNYTIPAEFVYPRYFHKKGALAAARTGDQVNPERASSGSQFYIVTGRVMDNYELDMMEKRMEYSKKQSIFNQLAMEHREAIMLMQQQGDQAGLDSLQRQLIPQVEAMYAASPAKLTDEQRKAYSTIGGTPHLDGEYTVFGEVIKGLEIVDKIQSVATDGHDRPVDDIKIISAKVL